MKYTIIIMGFIMQTYQVPLLNANSPQNIIPSVIIYNNHKITQTVTSHPQGNSRNNRLSGHTKNGTPSTFNDSISIPTADYSLIPTIDNKHVIHQHTMHTVDNGGEMGACASEQVPAPINPPTRFYSSWLSAFIPPIIAQSSGIGYVFAGLGICYAALMIKLLHTSFFTLAKNNTWSSWKTSISIENMAANEKQFAQELFTAIQNAYVHAPVNAHFLSPLVHFINDSDKELCQLKTFIALHKKINSSPIACIFPRQQKALEIAQEKIQRLEYFKNIIINWVGEYRI